MKKFRILLIGLLFIIYPVSVHGLTGSVNISCNPTSVKPGDTVTCSITGTSDGVVTAFEADLGITGGIAPSSFTSTNSKWEKCDLTDDKSSIGCYANTNDISGNFDFGTLTLTVAADATGEATLALSNVIFGDSNFHNIKDGITGGSATLTITSGGSDPQPPVTNEKGLSDLSCTSGGVLSPQFSSANKSYTLILNSVDTNSFSLSATAKNSSDSIVFKNGDATLDPGNITFSTSGGQSFMEVAITVGEGSSLVHYYIYVGKPSVTVGGKTISLVTGKTEYSVNLGSTNSFTIQASVADSSNFEISNSSEVLHRTFTDAASYSIIVSPKNSSSGYSAQTYIVHVSKAGSNTPATSDTPAVNPKTGTTGAIFMGIVLIVSLFATLSLYKKNIKGYSEGSK